MWEVLTFLNFLKEIHDIFPPQETKPEFYSQVWDDSCSCIKVTKSPNLLSGPSTYHLTIIIFGNMSAMEAIRISRINT